MQADQATTAPHDDKIYARNHRTLLQILGNSPNVASASTQERALSLTIERVLLDRVTAQLVSFEGDRGIAALLERIALRTPGCERTFYDGRLMGLNAQVRTASGSVVPMIVALGAGAQLACTVGPTPSISVLMEAADCFDRLVHLASTDLGCDYTLLSEGYNPLATTPLDIPMVPRTRWMLLNASIGTAGKYARDYMRCSCATRVDISFPHGDNTLTAYRLAAALSPIIMFLTDNVRSFRGSGARRCPRMARSLIWEDMDSTRCGIVPGTFASEFSFERYLAWLEGTQAVLFEVDDGQTTSTGKQLVREVIAAQPISASEGARMLRNVFPYARLTNKLELLQADAMRPRMAVGYAAFIKGLFCNDLSINSAYSLMDTTREDDVALAAHELRMHGWDAVVYGQKMDKLVDQLLQISRTALDIAEERRLMDEICELWDVRMVPRDAFVHQETKAARSW